MTGEVRDRFGGRQGYSEYENLWMNSPPEPTQLYGKGSLTTTKDTELRSARDQGHTWFCTRMCVCVCESVNGSVQQVAAASVLDRSENLLNGSLCVSSSVVRNFVEPPPTPPNSFTRTLLVSHKHSISGQLPVERWCWSWWWWGKSISFCAPGCRNCTGKEASLTSSEFVWGNRGRLGRWGWGFWEKSAIFESRDQDLVWK